jgi:hypothetical protein
LINTPSVHGAITYQITPFAPGVPGGIELVGGFFQTDGTIGDSIDIAIILVD